MAHILSIETTTTRCSVAVSRSKELVSLLEIDSEKYVHSEELHVLIESVCKNASTPLEKLDAVGISIGPGSYTGLRIGLSAAKGLCYALDIPLISVPTLEVLARQTKPDLGYICAILEARQMNVYSSIYDRNQQQLRQALCETISQRSFSEWTDPASHLTIIGNAVRKCEKTILSSNITYIESLPSAKEVSIISYEKFLKNTFEDLVYSEPLYLKEFGEK